MQWWQAVLLGIVQGLTEFLPVSSSGHLYLLQTWFDVEPALAFTFLVFVHVGTLAAILAYFWTDFRTMNRRQWRNIGFGLLPILAIGFLFHDELSDLRGTMWLSLTFGITTFLLLIAETLLRWLEEQPSHVVWRYIRHFHRWMTGEESPNWLQSLGVGFLQSVAVLPGVSRSGATLTGGLLAGLPRQDAFRYAFVLGAPTIFFAVLFDAWQLWQSEQLWIVPWNIVVLGILSSAITGWFALVILRWFWRQSSLWPFALYCGAVSILLVLFA